MVIQDTMDFSDDYYKRKQEYEKNRENREMIHINTEIGDASGDKGQFISIELDTYGETKEELLANASISYVDQDGGEIDTVGAEDYGLEAVEAIIDAEIEEVT